MPRKPRFFIAGIANHVIQRGNNKEAIFFEEEDYLKYKNILNNACIKNGVTIHAFVLMTNHVHILATSQSSNGISLMMQETGQTNIDRHFMKSQIIHEIGILVLKVTKIV